MRVYSPVKGKLKKIEQVNDDVFSQKMLGEGVAIIAENGDIAAPVNGTVSSVFPTNHAIGISSEDGLDVLIHIGIDTVELEGKGFHNFVKEGETVEKGDKLINVDFDYIKKAGYEGDVIMIITNSGEYSEIVTREEGNVDLEDVLMEVK